MNNYPTQRVHRMTKEQLRFLAYSNIRYWYTVAEERADYHIMWLFRNEYRCIVES